MKKDQIEEGKISRSSEGLGVPSPEMVSARARELAVINGRSPDHVLESDMEEARRELAGTGDMPDDEPSSISNTAQWDAAPGTQGTHAQVHPAHDEQTDIEKLTEEGMREAEHDRMVELERSQRREENV